MAPKLRSVSFSVLHTFARPASAGTSRSFTSTPCCEKMSKQRFTMMQWLKGPQARRFREPRGGPSYLGNMDDQPFPNNPLFRSQPVLTDRTRELIWSYIMEKGRSIKEVSAEMGIDVRRVAAVVRLKEVQRQWEQSGKDLAIPYAQAVMSMLPKTRYVEGEDNPPHEPINEIHVHKLTMQQLYVPVSESRQFTRKDAAQAFHDTILSADKISRQPELIEMEKAVIQGKTREESFQDFREQVQEQEQTIAQLLADKQKREDAKVSKVKTDRYEFRIKDVSVDDVGRAGRARKGVGWRYGAPHQDRRKGQVKIPTSVP